MLEKNGFFTFGSTVNLTDRPDVRNESFRNFINPAGLILGGVILKGRKKRADKNRQEIQDKYAELDVSCDGIDNSIRFVTKDLETLRANKPRKKLLNKKDELAWQARVSETEIVLDELKTTKRGLVCNQPQADTPPPRFK